MSDFLEILDVGIGWEESINEEEEKLQEWPDFDCQEMSGVLGVLVVPDAEI